MTASIATRAVGKTMSYLAPRLAPRSQGIDLSPMFENIDAANYRQNIPALINSIVTATNGCLAYDASATELTQQLQELAPPQHHAAAPSKGSYPEHVIQKVLEILRYRITPSELLAAEQILRGNRAKPAAQAAAPSVMGDDAYRPPRFTHDQRAREDFHRRFPEAARMKVEPSYAGPPPKAPTPVHNDPSIPSLYERFGIKPMRHA